jgi:hypothetical protein
MTLYITLYVIDVYGLLGIVIPAARPYRARPSLEQQIGFSGRQIAPIS